jgi:branched-chain amino acid transport system substrate-binding protein
MVGGNSSGVVLALMDVMAEHKIVWLGTGGALTNVVERIEKDYARYKYYFRVGTTDSAQQAKAIGQFALDVLGPNYGMRRFAVLGTDLQWARSALATASQMLEENGFEKTWEGFFPSNTTRFDSWFRQAEESGAEFILNYTLGGEGLSYIRQYHDLHVPLPIIGNHALSTRGEWWQETEGKTVWDMHFRFSGGDVALTPKTRPFLKAFLERYGVSPGFLSWPGYDALYILREAVQQAKSSESNSVIAQLEKLEYEGNVGYRFDARHDLTYGEADGKRYVVPVYFQWKPDGALRAVWPPEVAEAEYELPDWIQEKREP